jgi:hypothetical protein
MAFESLPHVTFVFYDSCNSEDGGPELIPSGCALISMPVEGLQCIIVAGILTSTREIIDTASHRPSVHDNDLIVNDIKTPLLTIPSPATGVIHPLQ